MIAGANVVVIVVGMCGGVVAVRLPRQHELTRSPARLFGDA
jgi:hypothetical protein